MADNLALTPIILCGGAGSRLWPMSRESKPKQFHRFMRRLKSRHARTVNPSRIIKICKNAVQEPFAFRQG